MAAVTKVGTPSLCTTTPCDANRLPPLLVGEDIAAGDPCYIKSDGKIWRSFDGGSLGTSAEVHGWAPVAAKVGGKQPLSLYRNVNMTYGSGLTPGRLVLPVHGRRDSDHGRGHADQADCIRDRRHADPRSRHPLIPPFSLLGLFPEQLNRKGSFHKCPTARFRLLTPWHPLTRVLQATARIGSGRSRSSRCWRPTTESWPT